MMPQMQQQILLPCARTQALLKLSLQVSSLSPTELDVTEAGLQYSCGRLRDADAEVGSRVLATDEGRS